jgi:hypothetical protein
LISSATSISNGERNTSQPPEAEQAAGLFKFIRTVQVTPDASSGMVSGYVHYVPGDRSFCRHPRSINMFKKLIRPALSLAMYASVVCIARREA